MFGESEVLFNIYFGVKYHSKMNRQDEGQKRFFYFMMLVFLALRNLDLYKGMLTTFSEVALQNPIEN